MFPFPAEMGFLWILYSWDQHKITWSDGAIPIFHLENTARYFPGRIHWEWVRDVPPLLALTRLFSPLQMPCYSCGIREQSTSPASIPHAHNHSPASRKSEALSGWLSLHVMLWKYINSDFTLSIGGLQCFLWDQIDLTVAKHYSGCWFLNPFSTWTFLSC